MVVSLAASLGHSSGGRVKPKPAAAPAKPAAAPPSRLAAATAHLTAQHTTHPLAQPYTTPGTISLPRPAAKPPAVKSVVAAKPAALRPGDPRANKKWLAKNPVKGKQAIANYDATHPKGFNAAAGGKTVASQAAYAKTHPKWAGLKKGVWAAKNPAAAAAKAATATPPPAVTPTPKPAPTPQTGVEAAVPNRGIGMMGRGV